MRPQADMEAQNSLEALGFEEIVYTPPRKAAGAASEGQIGAPVSGPRTGESVKLDTHYHQQQRDQQQQWWQGPNPYGDRDQRSVYVCNLNPSTSKDQLQRFFSTCGNIRCITIPLDPEVHQPLGHAYVEFSHAAEAEAAAKLTKQQLEGRQITVYPKKTNIRGYDVFQGHTGYSRRGRRGFGRGGFGNTFGRQGAAFPEWGQ